VDTKSTSYGDWTYKFPSFAVVVSFFSPLSLTAMRLESFLENCDKRIADIIDVTIFAWLLVEIYHCRTAEWLTIPYIPTLEDLEPLLPFNGRFYHQRNLNASRLHRPIAYSINHRRRYNGCWDTMSNSGLDHGLIDITM
jgi:hypothetical protein